MPERLLPGIAARALSMADPLTASNTWHSAPIRRPPRCEGSRWLSSASCRTREICSTGLRGDSERTRVQMPPGVGVSGLESDGAQAFYCGGGKSGKVRAVRPRRGRG
jgi:hypothetical protein